MTVEARHINLFSSLPLSNSKEMLNRTSMEANTYSNSVAVVGGARTGFYPATDSAFPSCNTQIGDSVMQRLAKSMNRHIVNPPLKDNSILTFNNDVVDLPLPRKRRREATAVTNTNIAIGGSGTESVSFLGDDLSVQMVQQQFELDRLIFLHMEKVKREIEEQRRMQSNRTIRVIEEAIAKKLREKDEQIENMSKLNVTLQDRVKSLYLENQLWRDLAHSNEATANALRSNLEQLLVQVNNKAGDDCIRPGDVADTESCCGSSGGAAEEEWNEVDGAQILQWKKVARAGGKGPVAEERSKRMCRRCGGSESCVLVLPCRHLCLCTACGPTVHVCPICNSTKNASVHVNFS